MTQHRQIARRAHGVKKTAVTLEELLQHDVILPVELHVQQHGQLAERRNALGIVMEAAEEHR